MRGLPRRAPAAREPRRPGEGPHDPATREAADLRRASRVRVDGALGARGADRRPHPPRDRRAPAVPGRRRRRLPHAGPQRGDAVGRRGAAHPARDADRREPARRAVRARRAVDRPAPARQPAPADDAPAPARPRQHGHRRRARRGDDPVGRLRDRPRPGRRRARRARDLPGHARRPAAPRSRVAHRPVPAARADDPRAAGAARPAPRRARHPRRPGEQPEEPRRAHPARPADRRHRRERVGQVDARQRHPVPRAGAHALPGQRRARPPRSHRGHRAHRQGDRDRPVADRPDAALEPGHLHGPVHVHPRPVRADARGARPRASSPAASRST